MGDKVLGRAIAAGAVCAVFAVCQPVFGAEKSASTTVAVVSGSISGTVRVTSQGKAKADASGVVVYAVGFEQQPPSVVPKMTSKDRQFLPRVLPITVGQRVDFPNADAFFHNVFSLSKARKFDLGQYKKGSSKDKAFPRKGIIEVYCNIHPQMSATILVLPNRAHAVTDKQGRYTITDVPPGTWRVFAYSRHAQLPSKGSATVVAGRPAAVDFSINETRLTFAHKNKYGEDYRDGKKKY